MLESLPVNHQQNVRKQESHVRQETTTIKTRALALVGLQFEEHNSHLQLVEDSSLTESLQMQFNQGRRLSAATKRQHQVTLSSVSVFYVMLQCVCEKRVKI